MHPCEKSIGSHHLGQSEKKQVALGAPSPRLTLPRGCSPWGPPACSPWGPPARATPLSSHPQAFTPPSLKHRWMPPPCPGVCTCLTAGRPPKEATVVGERPPRVLSPPCSLLWTRPSLAPSPPPRPPRPDTCDLGTEGVAGRRLVRGVLVLRWGSQAEPTTLGRLRPL